MNKESFSRTFRDAVATACEYAESRLQRKLSRDFMVRMYGAGSNGVDVSPEEFIDHAYINEGVFYRLIDIMVVEVVGTNPVVFARISDHEPGPLSMSYGGERGPFKQLLAHTIPQK